MDFLGSPGSPFWIWKIVIVALEDASAAVELSFSNQILEINFKSGLPERGLA